MIVQFQLFSAVAAGPQGPLVNDFFFLWFRLKSALSVFPGPKVLLFCLQSVPWTSNELAENDVEKCEKSSLTPTKSPTPFEFCISQRWNTLEVMSDSDVYLPSASSTESCYTSYSSSREEMEVVSTVQP